MPYETTDEGQTRVIPHRQLVRLKGITEYPFHYHGERECLTLFFLLDAGEATSCQNHSLKMCVRDLREMSFLRSFVSICAVCCRLQWSG